MIFQSGDPFFISHSLFPFSFPILFLWIISLFSENAAPCDPSFPFNLRFSPFFLPSFPPFLFHSLLVSHSLLVCPQNLNFTPSPKTFIFNRSLLRNPARSTRRRCRTIFRYRQNHYSKPGKNPFVQGISGKRPFF